MRATGDFCSLVTLPGGTSHITAARLMRVRKLSSPWLSAHSSTCLIQSLSSSFLWSFKVNELIQALTSRSWYLLGRVLWVPSSAVPKLGFIGKGVAGVGVAVRLRAPTDTSNP